MSDREVRVTLTVIEGPDRGLSVPLEKARTTIGRRRVDIPLKDKKVSGVHAAIEIVGSKVMVSDEESRNGVLVNGSQIEEAKLKNLDEIQLGMTKFKVLIVEDLEAFKTRNLGGAQDPGKSPKKGPPAERISSMIDDELKQFSKWDLDHAPEESFSDVPRAKESFVMEVLEGPEVGKRFRIEKETTTVGRGRADVSIADGDISRLHAALEIGVNGQVMIRDVGSTNGTFVNSKRVTEAKLVVGDQIQMGSTVLKLLSGDE